MITSNAAGILIYGGFLTGSPQQDLFSIMLILGVYDFCFGENDYIDGHDYALSRQGPISIKIHRFTVDSEFYDDKDEIIPDPVLQDIARLDIDKNKFYQMELSLWYEHEKIAKDQKLSLEFWTNCMDVLLLNGFRIFNEEIEPYGKYTKTTLVEVREGVQ